MSLSELYSEKLNEYRKTRELQVAPSQVLSMLLLDKKDDFFPSNADIEHFYHDYSGEIKKDVYKLGDDFSLKIPDDEDEFWYIYGDAMEVLFSGVTEMSLVRGEDVYQYYYGENVKNKNKVKKIGGIK